MTIKVVSKNGDLAGEYIGVNYPPFSFIPTTDGKFRDRSFWMPAEFVRGEDGKVAELKLEDFRGKKVGANE